MMHVRQWQVFRHLDRVCKPTCLLASNTSSLDIDQITATATAAPSSSKSSLSIASTDADGGGLSPARGEYLFGMHFFTPAHLMKLIEIVVCKVTSPDVLEAAVTVTKRLGKSIGQLLQPVTHQTSSCYWNTILCP